MKIEEVKRFSLRTSASDVWQSSLLPVFIVDVKIKISYINNSILILYL